MEVDAELAARIEGKQRARSDIAAVLRDSAPADTPAGFESGASRLSEADSSIIHIYRQLYDEDAMADLRNMVDADTDAVGNEIAALPANADETARQQLANRLAPVRARQHDRLSLADQSSGAPIPRARTSRIDVYIEAMVGYSDNPAQLRCSCPSPERPRPPAAP